jgi:tetratricopeptide (TPR) repeat protein
MKLTDAQCFSRLATHSAHGLNEIEIYKGCVFPANNGDLRPEESSLSSPFRLFLEARRFIKIGSFDIARNLLDSASTEQIAILEGDRDFLRGIVEQRLGNYRQAAQRMLSAAEIFRKIGDNHRFLRAMINFEIYGMNFESFVSGNLYALQRLAYSEGYHDLVGNIQKAYSVELLNRGEFQTAVVVAADAVESYSKSSDPEDQSVAQCLVAIAHWLVGNKLQAQEHIKRTKIRDGKVKTYYTCFQNLFQGGIPELRKDHPLYQTPWIHPLFKARSITGKLIGHLQMRPATRDELIKEIWGADAFHSSYRDRLYSALKEIRKKIGVNIQFDGSHYRLE